MECSALQLMGSKPMCGAVIGAGVPRAGECFELEGFWLNEVQLAPA